MYIRWSTLHHLHLKTSLIFSCWSIFLQVKSRNIWAKWLEPQDSIQICNAILRSMVCYKLLLYKSHFKSSCNWRHCYVCKLQCLCLHIFSTDSSWTISCFEGELISINLIVICVSYFIWPKKQCNVYVHYFVRSFNFLFVNLCQHMIVNVKLQFLAQSVDRRSNYRVLSPIMPMSSIILELDPQGGLMKKTEWICNIVISLTILRKTCERLNKINQL